MLYKKSNTEKSSQTISTQFLKSYRFTPKKMCQTALKLNYCSIVNYNIPKYTLIAKNLHFSFIYGLAINIDTSIKFDQHFF